MGEGEVLDVAAAHEFLAAWAATRRASPSLVAAGAVSTPWPPSPSSRTCGPPASPASPFSISSTASSTRRSARTCAGGTARTPGTSSATGRGWSTTRPSTISRAWRRRSCSSAAPSTPAPAAPDLRGRGDAARPRPGLRLLRISRRGPRDQRPRAPRRLRPAHGGFHPAAHRLRLTGERARSATTRADARAAARTTTLSDARRGQRPRRACRLVSSARSGTRTPPARPSPPRRRR